MRITRTVFATVGLARHLPLGSFQLVGLEELALCVNI
jgi:hypothetical protein